MRSCFHIGKVTLINLLYCLIKGGYVNLDGFYVSCFLLLLLLKKKQTIFIAHSPGSGFCGTNEHTLPGGVKVQYLVIVVSKPRVHQGHMVHEMNADSKYHFSQCLIYYAPLLQYLMFLLGIDKEYATQYDVPNC